MAIRNLTLKGFAVAALLTAGIAVSGSIQEAKAQMMYGPAPGQPWQQSVAQYPQGNPPQQYANGYATPKRYKRYVNTSGGYSGYGRYYGPRYGYSGYSCPWW